MRITSTVAVFAVASAMTVAACGGKTTGGTDSAGSPAPPQSAAARQLRASVKGFSTTPYRYTLNLSVGVDIAGSADPTAGGLSQNAKVTLGGADITFNLVVAGGQYYAKIGGVPVPGVDAARWQHVNPARLKSVRNLLIVAVDDPTGVQAASASIVSARMTGDGQFAGTLDLTRGGESIPGVSASDFTDLGDRAKAVPFAATVDPRGRLTAFKLSVPAAGSAPAVAIAFTYRDFGSRVSVAKPPAAQTVDAPAGAYAFLNRP